MELKVGTKLRWANQPDNIFIIVSRTDHKQGGQFTWNALDGTGTIINTGISADLKICELIDAGKLIVVNGLNKTSTTEQSCTCGAAHTSNIDYHSNWCDKNKG